MTITKHINCGKDKISSLDYSKPYCCNGCDNFIFHNEPYYNEEPKRNGYNCYCSISCLENSKEWHKNNNLNSEEVY